MHGYGIISYLYCNVMEIARLELFGMLTLMHVFTCGSCSHSHDIIAINSYIRSSIHCHLSNLHNKDILEDINIARCFPGSYVYCYVVLKVVC